MGRACSQNGRCGDLLILRDESRGKRPLSPRQRWGNTIRIDI